MGSSGFVGNQNSTGTCSYTLVCIHGHSFKNYAIESSDFVEIIFAYKSYYLLQVYIIISE